jgi:hypothetical protein
MQFAQTTYEFKDTTAIITLNRPETQPSGEAQRAECAAAARTGGCD